MAAVSQVLESSNSVSTTEVKVKVILRPTVNQSWCQAPIWDQRPIFSILCLIVFRQLRVCWCGAPSLTRSLVCNFQFLLGIANAAFLRSESHGTHVGADFNFFVWELFSLLGAYYWPSLHSSGMDRTENLSSIIACSVVAGKTCPHSCALTTAVVLSLVYTAVTRQWACMSHSVWRSLYVMQHLFITFHDAWYAVSPDLICHVYVSIMSVMFHILKMYDNNDNN
jgi:hypothetical protein